MKSGIKDQIRQKIERQLEYFKVKEDDTWDDCDNYTDEDAMWYQGHWKMCSRLLSFIDSLPEEACKDSLQAPETCKENTDSFTSLEEVAEEYATMHLRNNEFPTADSAFIAGANWMRKKDVEDMYLSDNRHFLKCYEQGKVDMRVEMMKDAVEGEIGYWNQRGLSIRLDKSLERLGYDMDTKVKIVIEKQDDRPRD